MAKNLLIVAVMLGCFAFAVPLFAHHGTASFDTDKTLKVTVDATTDITDGEQDRALKSLTAGTEVDVEYDPATSKATYIFVY